MRSTEAQMFRMHGRCDHKRRKEQSRDNKRHENSGRRERLQKRGRLDRRRSNKSVKRSR